LENTSFITSKQFSKMLWWVGSLNQLVIRWLGLDS
jgi:hypothetical protein